jgi:hypothetical protein
LVVAKQFRFEVEFGNCFGRGLRRHRESGRAER